MKRGSCPAVSILMPVWNEGRFLASALRSLAAQTLKEWELVVVDDGSTDNTSHILTDAAYTDPRIRVLKSVKQGHCACVEFRSGRLPGPGWKVEPGIERCVTRVYGFRAGLMLTRARSG